MTLLFDLPEWVEAIVKTKYKDEHVMFAVPHDLNEDNKLQEGMFVVTEKLLLLFADGEVKKEYKIHDFKEYKATMFTSSGILEAVNVNDHEQYMLFRFTMEHGPRIATIARKLNLYIEGKDMDFYIEEQDPKCTKCNKVLPKDSSICPFCANKLDVIVRLLKLSKKYVPYLLFENGTVACNNCGKHPDAQILFRAGRQCIHATRGKPWGTIHADICTSDFWLRHV